LIPTPIPDDLVRPGTVRQTFNPPNDHPGDAEIDPCEALVSRGAGDLAAVHVRLELEPGEIERLLAGEPVWVTQLGGLLPTSVVVGEPPIR
jgi:hypothetical protein